MSSARDLPSYPALLLVTTLLRAWAVGFALAALGTWWVLRKSLRLLPFRQARRGPEGLVD
jgi:hypothetical protein